jgi:WD40 repeat protein
MSNPIGERNLLFGILAFHKQFISSDTFAEAIQRWTQAKKKDLAQILREQKALTENQHALLEESIDALVARHGNDLPKSLAALWLGGTARQEIEKIADRDVQAALAHVSGEPIEEAEAVSEEETGVEAGVAPLVVEPAPPKATARPKRPREVKPSTIPVWVLIAGVVAVAGIGIALIAGVAVVVAMFALAIPVADHNQNAEPLVQARVDEFPIQPIEPPVVNPPVKAPVNDPPAVKPPVKAPEADPPVVKPAVKAPAVAAKDDFVPLFNGKDLTGWRLHKQSADIWRVENGILIGDGVKGKMGRLNTENPQPRDFHLRVEMRLGAKAMGNVGFRCPVDSNLGYNTQFHTMNAKVVAGGMSVQTPGFGKGLGFRDVPAIDPDQWFTLEILAQGSRFILKVNGVTTTDIVEGTHAQAGHITLNQIMRTPIEFRRIEIKELPPVAVPDLVARVPVVSGFLLELPPPAGRACLSADGLRVAYTVPTVGAFAFREAPAFDVEKVAAVKEILTPLHPLASSPDGQRMAFTAGTKDGPKVLLFHWGANRFETTFSFTNLAISSAFSPDGKYLATYLIQTPKGQPVEYWLHLHEIATGVSLKQWQLDSAPNFFGFMPDSRKLFLAAKRDNLARTWNIADAQPGTMAFPDISKKHFFARDFSRFTYAPMPHQLQVTFTIGQRGVGKMDMKNPATQIAASAFSPDNRYLLIGADDPDNPPLGRAMLFEFSTGKEIGNIQKLAGVPDRIDFAANGIGLLQGQNLRPRLYRLPIGDALAKVQGPPPLAAGFVQLFNGKDLTGWKTHPKRPGDWRVKDGVLIGSGAPFDALYTARNDYKDFHLRMEARINEGGNGAVFVRGPFGPMAPPLNPIRPIGFQVSVNNTKNSPNRTGSITLRGPTSAASRGYASLLTPEEWFTLEILAQDNRVTVKINGKPVETMADKDRQFASGAIALYLEKTGSVIEFRNIEIKELNPGPVVPVAGGKPLELKTNNGNVSVLSSLVQNDPPYKNKKISKSFLMPMEEGRTYQIDYRSTVFDCYLYLEDPDGRIVAEDDDGGGGLDSRIIHKAAKSGKYRIIATSLVGSSTGQFSINITATGNAVAKAPLAEGFTPPKEKVVAMGPIGDYVALFNGKDLTGWAVEGKDGWKVADSGELVGHGPDTVLLTNRKDFKNFNARIELSASADADAFLAFRENPGPNAAVKLKGLTTRLIGDGESVSAGNIGLNGTKFESGQQRVKVKAGEAIALEIQVRDDSIRISTNGKATAAMPVPPGYPPGAIGLHLAKGTVRVKKFEVAEEPAAIAKEGVPAEPLPIAKAEFVPLFNGKDLAGWQPHAKRPGNWRVENGVLTGSAPVGGALYTTRGDYQDFHLRAEARINDKGFGRLIVRAAYDPTKVPFKTLGYEALINQRPVGAKTGTLTATSATGAVTTPAKDAAAPAGEWFLLEIIAKGDLVTVKVNGTIVAESLDERNKFATKGHIVLQQDANAVLEFRKVEIMDPTAAKAAAPPPVVPIEPPPEKRDKGGFTARFNPGDAGKWRVEGKELVQEALKPNVSIFFGDPKWTDYDFSVWAMRTQGNDQFALWFRRADDNDLYLFALGAKKNTEHMAARIKSGNTLQQSLLDAKDSAIETDRWHHAKVSVRGDQALCYLDGVKLFEFTADKLRAGAVGLRTWDSAYRFKNIKVTAPDGTVLLEGAPDLPRAPR